MPFATAVAKGGSGLVVLCLRLDDMRRSLRERVGRAALMEQICTVERTWCARSRRLAYLAWAVFWLTLSLASVFGDVVWELSVGLECVCVTCRIITVVCARGEERQHGANMVKYAPADAETRVRVAMKLCVIASRRRARAAFPVSQHART